MSARPERSADRVREAAAVAAIALVPFTVVLATAFAVTGFPPERRASADPLVQLLGAAAAPAIVALALGVSAAWWIAVRPNRAAMDRGLRRGGVAVMLVVLALPLARLAIGPALPSFIPPEESARPGLVGGLGAGVLEEAVFRLMLLPALLAACGFVGAPAARFALASAVVAVVFALAHETGPRAEPVHLAYFVSRLVLPGFLMSLACRWPGFTFVVCGHCTAHVLLPFLFR